MSTASSTTSPPTDGDAAGAELLPGYYIEESTGAWLTLPWPDDLTLLPPSLAPGLFRWAAGESVWGLPALEGPRLIHHLTGDPWVFTLGQRKFLHLWYAVRPDVRWMFRSGVKRGAKGTGKDPLCGAMCMLELAGPTRCVGFDAAGNPIGEPHRLALVQIGANSEAQAKDVLRVANAMTTYEFREEVGMDTGVLATVLTNGSRIELLTRSEKSSEGDPATAIFLNETHHMTSSSGGQDLAGVARRNVGKSPGGYARAAEFTNAHMPGEDSVAEDSFTAWQQQVSGQTRRVDILYDSREAPPHLRLHVEEELEEGIAAAYADSPWTDKERIRDEAQDPRVPLADSVRYYFNALPTNEMAWVDPRKFDEKARPDIVTPQGEPIAMFLDCSKSTDATVLYASRISDGHVITLGHWQRPHGDAGKGWLAPRETVDAFVMDAKGRYDVQWFGVDPSPAKDDETEAQYWAPMVDKWHREFRESVLLWATPGVTRGNSVAFDMRLSVPGGRERNLLFTEAAEQTAADIDGDAGNPGTLTWDGDARLRVHVHNARRRPNQWGVSLGKQSRDSSNLVDGAVAMVGARMGRRLVLNSGKVRERRSGVVY